VARLVRAWFALCGALRDSRTEPEPDKQSPVIWRTADCSS
jgi:hypothetical protein